MQSVKRSAHLLAVWCLSAGKREQLEEEGAQEESSADRCGHHGREAGGTGAKPDVTGGEREKKLADVNFSSLKSYRRNNPGWR